MIALLNLSTYQRNAPTTTWLYCVAQIYTPDIRKRNVRCNYRQQPQAHQDSIPASTPSCPSTYANAKTKAKGAERSEFLRSAPRPPPDLD